MSPSTVSMEQFLALEARVANLERLAIAGLAHPAAAATAPAETKPAGQSWHAIHRETHAGKKVSRRAWGEQRYLELAEDRPNLTVVEVGEKPGDPTIRRPAVFQRKSLINPVDYVAEDWYILEK